MAETNWKNCFHYQFATNISRCINIFLISCNLNVKYTKLSRINYLQKKKNKNVMEIGFSNIFYCRFLINLMDLNFYFFLFLKHLYDIIRCVTVIEIPFKLASSSFNNLYPVFIINYRYYHNVSINIYIFIHNNIRCIDMILVSILYEKYVYKNDVIVL